MAAPDFPKARCPGCGQRLPRNTNGEIRRHDNPHGRGNRYQRGICRGPLLDLQRAYAIVHAFAALRQ